MKKNHFKPIILFLMMIWTLCAVPIFAETPAAVTSISLKTASNSSLNLFWKTVPNADGYAVWISETPNGEYALLGYASATSTNGSISSLLSGKKYYVRIQAFTYDESYNRVFGPVSKTVVAATSPLRMKFASQNKKAILYWEGAGIAAGYQIYRSTSKSGKYTRVKTVTSPKTLAWTDTKTKAGKKYFYKIRAYARDDKGQVVFGGFSSPYAYTVSKTNKSVYVAPTKLQRYKNLKRNCSTAQFNSAYKKARSIVTPLLFKSRKEQLVGIATALRKMVDSGKVRYSTNAAHYNDPYGYFVKGVSSCAGCTRATGLCLNMLGIKYEHVNENKWKHQWCRVKIGNEYWICDAYGLYVGKEPGPRRHPYF